MEFIWKNSTSNIDTEVNQLHKSLGIDLWLCKLLVKRGIKTFEEAKEFFRPNLEHTHSPFLMKGMQEAVNRIKQARDTNQKVMIYGDYDVDGTTAVACLFSFLKNYHKNLICYIPDRYTEGYGVSTQGIDTAHEENASLIIALDCGIKSLDKVAYARSKGIDFIICDHHLPGDELPEAIAVLDPKRSDCTYPFKELSGCGIAFKLSQALAQEWSLSDESYMNQIDLVALSIGADIVAINGENRILAFHGLKKINQNPRPGLAELKDLAGFNSKPMTITDMVFTLGPRINAAGRIEHGKLAVELLSSIDINEIKDKAQLIDLQNQERKTLDQEISESALSQIKKDQKENSNSTVVYKKDWHKGVIGIVASRLIEQYYRPTIVFTQSQGVLAGSARSVRGFNIYNAIESCSKHLIQFGGHAFAAGMTLHEENLQAFTDCFEKYVAENISEDCKQPQLKIDTEISLKDITEANYKILKQFAPFGPENSAPLFLTTGFINSSSRLVGKESEHIKFSVKEIRSGIVINGIGFKLKEKFHLIENGEFDLVYHLEENHFMGNTNLEMRVLDIKPSNLM